MEREVKWAASSRGAFARFISALKQTAETLSAPADLSITDRYLDTPDNTLSAQKVALRIRRTGNAFEATLKTRTQLINGVARREEYTKSFPLARSFPGALKMLTKSASWHGVALNNLAVRFVLHNRRRTYQIRFQDCWCEAALDSYVISAAGKRLKKREIELELKRGTEKKFLELTSVLSDLSALPYAQISKVASAEKLLKQKN